MGRRLPFAAAAILLSTGATLALVEVGFRVANPAPRVQVVRLDEPIRHTAEHEGVTLFWDDDFGGPVRGGPCRPGQPVVGVFGDSVQLVSGPEFDLPRTATFLRDRLAADGFDACVLDTSFAGWKPQQVVAMLRKTAAETPLDVAVVGVWKPDQRYVRVGDLLIEGEVLAHDPDGVPRPAVPLPAPLHRWLLGHSAAWRYATLALDPPAPAARPPDTAYREALAFGVDRGLPLVFLEGAWMDRPFAQQRQEREADPGTWQARLAADARAQGAAWVWMADALGDVPVEEVRLDTCCHVDVGGHLLVAAAVAPAVEAALVAKGRQPTVAEPEAAATPVTNPGTGPR